MNENDNTANAVNGSGAFDVEGNPLDTGRLWPIDQAALISGVTTRTLRYCDWSRPPAPGRHRIKPRP